MFVRAATLALLLLSLAFPAGAADDLRLLGQSNVCGAGPCARVVQLTFYKALGDTVLYDWHRLAGYAQQNPHVELVALTPYAGTLSATRVSAPKIDFSGLTPAAAIARYRDRPSSRWSSDDFVEAAEKWWNEQVLPVLEQDSRTVLDLDLNGVVSLIGHELVRLGVPISGEFRPQLIEPIEVKLWGLAEAWRRQRPGQRALLVSYDMNHLSLMTPNGESKEKVTFGSSTAYQFALNGLKAVFGGLTPLPPLREFLAPVASLSEVDGFLQRADLAPSDRRPLILVNLNAGGFKAESATFNGHMRIEIAETLLKADPAPDLVLTVPASFDPSESARLAERLRAWNRRGTRVALIPGDQVALIDGLVERADLVVTRDTSLGHLAHARLGRDRMSKFIIFGMDRDFTTLANLNYWRPPGTPEFGEAAVEHDPLGRYLMLLRSLELSIGPALERLGFARAPTHRARFADSVRGIWQWCQRALLGTGD